MPKPRPLSPHLLIYRLQLTSALSIFHRICGASLALGSILAVWWLGALATGDEAYFNLVRAIAVSIPGRIILFGFSAAMFYHFFNGIRHMLWDAGIGLSIEGVYRGGVIVLAIAAFATTMLWLKVLGVF